jgi:hypothetical protein
MKLKFIIVGIVYIQVKGEEEFIDLSSITLEFKGRDWSEF